MIVKILRAHYRQRVAEVTKDPAGIWRIAKWATNRSGMAIVIPLLKLRDGTVAESYDLKVAALTEAFFPEPALLDLADIIYPAVKPVELPPIEEHEIAKAIKRSAAAKAPGLDMIPNLVLKHAQASILKHLVVLFNTCINTGYSPRAFRTSVTVVIRKAAKPDYT